MLGMVSRDPSNRFTRRRGTEGIHPGEVKFDSAAERQCDASKKWLAVW